MAYGVALAGAFVMSALRTMGAEFFGSRFAAVAYLIPVIGAAAFGGFRPRSLGDRSLRPRSRRRTPLGDRIDHADPFGRSHALDHLPDRRRRHAGIS